jgi:DNA repair exonuclease SbcCD ATPase subunit
MDRKGLISNPAFTGDGSSQPASGLDPESLGEVSRLLFLNEGEIYNPGAGDMELDRHLERLLPLGPLQNLSALARDEKRTVGRPMKGRRNELKVSKDESARLGERRTVLEAELQDIERLETSLREGERELLASVQERDLQQQVVLRFESWQKQLDQLFEANGLIGFTPEAALQHLGDDVQRSELRVRELAERRGQHQGERTGVEIALELLSHADAGTCPLCAHPLTNEHRDNLLKNQRDRLVQLDQLILSTSTDLAEAQRTLGTFAAAQNSVQTQVAQRPEMSHIPTEGPPNINEDLSRVKNDVRDLRDRRVAVFNELATVRESLAAAETDRRILEEVVESYRKEALLEAIEMTVDTFTSEIRSGTVVPLSQELGQQWKRFRPSAPWKLIIDKDGRLAIEMHGETRPHNVLSAGEKTVAIVLLKLALAVAFTSARFVVLDEPLEHLDPRTRRVLISSLQYAVENGVVDQIIVSTYEEAIVRRLQLQGLANAIYMDQLDQPQS